MRFDGAILLINSLNQFRSVDNCLDMFKINFNFEKEKVFFQNFKKLGACGGGQKNYFFCLLPKRATVTVTRRRRDKSIASMSIESQVMSSNKTKTAITL